EASWAMAVDGSGNAYIAGATAGSIGGPKVGKSDAFLVKFSNDGSVLWARQLGSNTYDSCRGVTVDDFGNVYICGATQGDLGGPHVGEWDTFLAKYSEAGDLLWVRQLGTPETDWSHSVAVDALGNVCVTGNTAGSFAGPNAGDWDMFLAKFDKEGVLLWSRQIGTSDHDESKGVAVNASGQIFIAGRTKGVLADANAGEADCFLAKFDPDGTIVWSRQMGTERSDHGEALAVDCQGNVYMGGDTGGSLAGTSLGETDIFLMKFAAPS
ncbi:unnamed protein product, partial [marine sediment metagenome]